LGFFFGQDLISKDQILATLIRIVKEALRVSERREDFELKYLSSGITFYPTEHFHFPLRFFETSEKGFAVTSSDPELCKTRRIEILEEQPNPTLEGERRLSLL
jgi:hypothetical protein